MLGPQTRVPMRGPSANPASPLGPEDDAAGAHPREPWTEAGRAPLSLRRALLFLLFAWILGFVVLVIVARLMGF